MFLDLLSTPEEKINESNLLLSTHWIECRLENIRYDRGYQTSNGRPGTAIIVKAYQVQGRAPKTFETERNTVCFTQTFFQNCTAFGEPS